MKIILVGTPKDRAHFVDSMRKTLECSYETNAEVRFKLQQDMLVMNTVKPEALKGDAVKASLKAADAVIYTGMQAKHLNAFEIEFMKNFQADTLLKNLHQVMQDHRANNTSTMRRVG